MIKNNLCAVLKYLIHSARRAISDALPELHFASILFVLFEQRYNRCLALSVALLVIEIRIYSFLSFRYFHLRGKKTEEQQTRTC